MTTDDWRDLNRVMWDERVPIHVAGDFYDVPAFLAGRSTLRPFERSELPDVAGRSLVHLQCHFGLDTLSWAREGAHVSGLDFSGPAVDAARDLAHRAGLDATFVQADVHDAVEVFGTARFDVVYTGIGALLWLPDMDRWAAVVAGLLRPGGVLYLVEMHPVTEIFGDDDLAVTGGYFDEGPIEWDEPGSYADLDAATVHNRSVEWRHPLSDVLTALARHGFRLEILSEHDHTVSPRWPFLERQDDGTYRLPTGTPRLPLMYSLRARLT